MFNYIYTIYLYFCSFILTKHMLLCVAMVVVPGNIMKKVQ